MSGDVPVRWPGREALLLVPVVGAGAALFWIVPEWPHRHLDDPSHWGVMGYVALAVLLGVRTARGRSAWTPRAMALFLAAMPLVYLADWARFGGSGGWLAVEAAGALGYGTVAWLGVAGRLWLLPAGIAAHGLWDLAHLGPVAPFVPDWYALACVVADGAVAVGLAGAMIPGVGAEG